MAVGTVTAGRSALISLDEFQGVNTHTGITEEINSEIKRLRAEHDEYPGKAKSWRFYQAAYEGGEEFANESNLFKHTRENEYDYTSRVDRLHNMNYCMPLVDFFTNFIFSEPIERLGNSNQDWYSKFIRDVNFKSETIDDFMRQVCDDMQIYGMTYILVDTPALPETDANNPAAVFTKQDEIDLGIRPYWVHIKPYEITDWQVDKFGNLVYAKRKQLDTRIEDGQKHHLELYTEFYPDQFVLSVVDTSEKDVAKYRGRKIVLNKLGKIPMVVARFKRSKNHPHLGLSFLRDFAYNNREVMNLTSLLQEFLYRQAFNILSKQVESGVPLREQEDGVIGSSNVMEYPRGAERPAYITPPSDPAKFIQDERGRIITQMYLRASQDTMNEMFNGEKSSGFSQSQSFSKTVPFISSRADTLERTEIALMELTLEMLGKDWDGKISYKDRYELTNLTSALTQLQILVRDFQIPSETFVKTQLKRMVHEFDGKLSIEDQTAIEKQIDEMDFKEWQETQKTAFVGAPATSPGAQQKPKQDGVTLSEREAQSNGAGMRTTATTKLRE